MKRFLVQAGCLGIALTVSLSACGNGFNLLPEEPIRVSTEIAVSPTGLTPTLLAKYYRVEAFTGDKSIRLEPQVGGLEYRPRYSQYPGYTGWDSLDVPNSNSSRTDWLRITLNREATVAVVTKTSFGWLSAWEKGSEIPGGFKSFKKKFPKGEFQLPSPGKGNDAFEVLFAESDSKASSAPTLPSKAPAGATLPEPGKKCPDWLHHEYNVVGRDGITYDSWHPQIDPVYWCHYGHEHGSDPALIGYTGSALEYIARLNSDQPEIHEGFKNFVMRDDETGLGWYISVHAETGFHHRLCVQNHTVVIAATALKDNAAKGWKAGELLAEVGFKGDFGPSIVNNTVADKNPPIQMTMEGMTCPNQAEIEAKIRAERKDGQLKRFKRIRVAAEPYGNHGYEQWDGGLQKELGFSFPDWHGGLLMDIRNPATACNTLLCTQVVRNRNDHGDSRTIALYDISLKYKASLDTISGAAADGVFYTNLYGDQFSDKESAAFSVRQYIKPGLDIMMPKGHFETQDAWRGLYVEGGGAPRIELEDGLSEVN
jgi:hypothetical protein